MKLKDTTQEMQGIIDRLGAIHANKDAGRRLAREMATAMIEGIRSRTDEEIVAEVRTLTRDGQVAYANALNYYVRMER